MRPLPCIICGADLKPAVADHDPSDPANLPWGGTVFMTYGSFGSTVFDSLGDREWLELNICDACLVAKAGAGVILLGCRDGRWEGPARQITEYRKAPWKPGAGQ